MTNLKKQRDFFNKSENVYSQDLIIKPPIHTELEINEIIKRLDEKRDLEVIDFGAGSGRITIPLLKKGLKVWAIDISENSLFALKRAAKNLKLTKLYTAKQLPKNKEFEVIVGADILHHVDFDEILPILYQALKINGKIIFSEPCALNPSWYLYLPFASSWGIEKGIVNLSYFNIIKKFKKYGFKKIKISGLGLLPRPLFMFSKKLCKLNDKLGNFPLFKIFAYRYIIEASK